MNTHQWNIIILLILIVQLQFIQCYPSSAINAQRTFLRCHFSAIACKRDLSDLKHSERALSSINESFLGACIKQHRSFWYCLRHPSVYTTESMNEFI